MQYAGLKHPGQIHYGSVESVCTEISTTAMFVQILVSSELMIFPVRALSWMWFNVASTWLYVLVFGASILFSCLAAIGKPSNLGVFGDIFSNQLGWTNTGVAWIWGLGTTLLLDAIKKTWVTIMDGNSEEIQCERVQEAQQAGMGARQSEAQQLTSRASSVLTTNRADSVFGGQQRPATYVGVGNAIFSEGKDPASLARAMARSRKSIRRASTMY